MSWGQSSGPVKVPWAWTWALSFLCLGLTDLHREDVEPRLCMGFKITRGASCGDT